MDLPVIAQALHQVVKIVHNPVKQLVHQLRLHHFRNVHDDALPGTGHPSGFGVGAAAAWENEDAGVGLLQGLQIGRKLAFGKWMVQSFGVLFKRPIRGVFVHVSPMEPIAAMRWITEVIYGETFGLEAFDYILIIWVSPAGGDVDHGR